MTRTRSIGGLACAIAVAGLVAGCGGGGYTAAESSPTGTTPAATTTTPAADASKATSAVIGAFPPEDPAVPQASFSGYQRFPQSRAGKIFADPTPVPPPVITPPAATPPAPVAAAPTASTTPATTTTTTAASVTTQMLASLEISGTVQSVKVGDQVPPDTKQFTVQAISTTKVTLKVNSGTLPGGGTTLDIAVGQSVTLSNPTTGASYAIKVVEVKQTTG